jgi:hypothetical protein
MALGGGEEIHLAVSPKAENSCIVNFTGVNVVGKSWAKRTVQKIVDRISDPASRQIVIQQQADAIRELRANYQSVATTTKPETVEAASAPTNSHFQDSVDHRDQAEKANGSGCAIVGWGAAVLLVAVIVLFVLTWSPESDAAGICKNHIRDRLRNPQSAQFEDSIVRGGPTRFQVSWMVQAENGFGGMNRRRQSCTVVYDSEPTLFSYPSYQVF